jgi:glyoxylase-like metal-dependent hydrolase (beta-lactamase superfamily II)/ferredoxin
MARADQRHPAGAAGDWFIDTRCIGCGASTSVAPALIRATDDGRFVFGRQPAGADEEHLAELAAEVCPTRSIGTVSRRRWPAHHPLAIAPRIWRCGHNASASAGGNSYWVERPDGGHLLIDGPRFSARLAEWMRARGGLAHVLLTHADDVADAGRYAEVLGAASVIHAADRAAAPFATRVLTGAESEEVAPGVRAIATPGHTGGHVMYLVDDDTLFSGDSLMWDPHGADLWAEREVCWHSWPMQLDSLERLAAYTFTQVIPGHGAVSPRLPAGELRERLRGLLGRLRG